MNRFVWSRSAVLAAMSVSALLAPSLSRAAEGSEDSLSLKIASALRSDRFFMRAGAILINIKTKSGDTRDVTGNVVSTAELENVFIARNPDQSNVKERADYPNIDFSTPNIPNRTEDQNFNALLNSLRGTVGNDTIVRILKLNSIPGIGTPPGMKGEAAHSAGTAGISVGYFLDDDYKWLVETYVLAAPVASSVSVRGQTVRDDGSGTFVTRPILIDGQKAITTKILPPTVLFGRYWGEKDSKLRPYTGVAAMYAIFTDTKATDTLNSYVGGSNPGDTTVSIKNAFGMGPVVGFKYQFADQWHASLNIGSVKLKTQATLTTRNTTFTNKSLIIQDLGVISDAITVGEDSYSGVVAGTGTVAREIASRNGGLTGLFMKGIAADRGQDNLGTYVRRTDTTLTNTIFFMSVGRTF